MEIETVGLRIIGSSLSVPKENLRNDEIWPETSEWVQNNLGIKSRSHLNSEETLLQLCIEAAKKCIADSGLMPQDIDCIIVATSTPEYVNPSMAAIVHGNVGAKPTCPAFDIQAVCAGFIYALGMVASLANSGSGKNFLVIGADQFSKITDFTRRDSVFFGDAAAAIMIKKTDSKNLFAVNLFADGKNWEDFHTRNSEEKFKQNAKEVTKNAVQKIPDAVIEICNKLDLNPSQISHYFTHQPSKIVLDKVEERLGVKPNSIYRNLSNRGNTASASIPSVFFDSGKFRLIKSGEYVCFAAIGSGWVWGVAILQWL
jgi:3-oxoacyl-[acyl-carrier-protein] synthase-3